MSASTPSHHTSPMQQRAIAFAAMMQAVYLVDAIARKGSADAEDSRALIESIFIKTAEHNSPEALYGGLGHLRTGIRVSREILAGRALPQSKALMGYCAGLLTIEQRLNKDRELRSRLADGMARIEKQKHYFGSATHPSVIAAIADLYGETISTMKPRIMVRGKTEHLGQQENTRRVRALLLSGLRAAHLWRNHGGSHLTLLFRRRALLRELDQLHDAIRLD